MWYNYYFSIDAIPRSFSYNHECLCKNQRTNALWMTWSDWIMIIDRWNARMKSIYHIKCIYPLSSLYVVLKITFLYMIQGIIGSVIFFSLLIWLSYLIFQCYYNSITIDQDMHWVKGPWLDFKINFSLLNGWPRVKAGRRILTL